VKEINTRGFESISLKTSKSKPFGNISKPSSRWILLVGVKAHANKFNNGQITKKTPKNKEE
jgi:hypothetical protein